ncbi:hypothetical protein HPB47_000216 [Ixodes persulcatus]|uniref:Uncharacterized protein n=1 Tax=Ixodes persulcatus TaxID=34615 RepID=A0AC60PSQ0_IXOPE|nr:hypothetical protein HPB47_000216 [Ixodes persulcatus]
MACDCKTEGQTDYMMNEAEAEEAVVRPRRPCLIHLRERGRMAQRTPVSLSLKRKRVLLRQRRKAQKKRARGLGGHLTQVHRVTATTAAEVKSRGSGVKRRCQDEPGRQANEGLNAIPGRHRSRRDRHVDGTRGWMEKDSCPG